MCGAKQIVTVRLRGWRNLASCKQIVISTSNSVTTRLEELGFMYDFNGLFERFSAEQ